MSRIDPVLALMAVAVVAGCGRQAAAPDPSPPAAPAAVSPATITYYCDDGRTVRASYAPPDTAIIEVDGVARVLRTARAASGARYLGQGVQWWTRGMDRGDLSLVAPGNDMAQAPEVNCSTIDAPVSPPEPGQPGGLADDRTPLSEAPFTPQSAQGAADVAQTYFALIGEKRFGDAWALWSDGGKASGQTREAFVAGFGRYLSYRALVGGPGPIEGAAGSAYVEVPVVIYGRLRSGPEVHQSGKAVLRRVNDVPGSTAEQRLWRIARMGLTPTP